ncbi:MAG TPA: NAD(P)-binding domain-containing protein [Kofleriaceae bacterium]|nr:NAD(P)-binding domain-containing protein [Kofleriaceae bacterium]
MLARADACRRGSFYVNVAAMQKIAIIGSGQVGDALAKGFLSFGHAVMRGSREPAKLQKWKDEAQGEASIGTLAEAAAWGEVIVLAVKGTAAEETIDLLGAANLAGKLILDATNPIADAPPDNGVLRYFTNANESLMERLQKKAPDAKFVKAFNSVGNAFMVNPPFDPKPTMFICGNDGEAKHQATAILTAFGWESVDVGGVEAARPIEALCQLWCAPGFLRQDWTHAFKYLKLS